MLRYLFAALFLAILQADIDYHAFRTQDPSDLSARSELMIVLDQNLDRMAAYPTDSCFTRWWAMRMAQMQLFLDAMVWDNLGQPDIAQHVITASNVARFQASRIEVSCP